MVDLLQREIDKERERIRAEERERCCTAIANHPGFTEDEKRIAIDVIRNR